MILCPSLRYFNTLQGTLRWTHTSSKMLLRIARLSGLVHSHCTPPNLLVNYQSTTAATLHHLVLQYILLVMLFVMRDSNYSMQVYMCY